VGDETTASVLLCDNPDEVFRETKNTEHYGGVGLVEEVIRGEVEERNGESGEDFSDHTLRGGQRPTCPFQQTCSPALKLSALGRAVSDDE
jgi:hypothetical protein